MIDLYEELELDINDSTEEIKARIGSLRTTWYRRMSVDEDRAHRMLAFIGDAEKFFENDLTRQQYDKELAESKKVPEQVDPDAERKAQFLKWKENANKYYTSRQYDLAKAAVDKALQNNFANDSEVLELAAKIYICEGNVDVAFLHINEAIVSAPNNPHHDYVKWTIQYKIETIPHNREEQIRTLNAALEKANRINSVKDKVIIIDALAKVAFNSGGYTNAEKHADAAINMQNALKEKNLIEFSFGVKKKIEEDRERQRKQRERKEEEQRKTQERSAHNARVQVDIDVIEDEIKQLLVNYNAKCGETTFDGNILAIVLWIMTGVLMVTGVFRSYGLNIASGYSTMFSMIAAIIITSFFAVGLFIPAIIFTIRFKNIKKHKKTKKELDTLQEKLNQLYLQLQK